MSGHSDSSREMGGSISPDTDQGHGHFFIKKTFHKPTYCHHCTDMLWGLIGQGFVCEGKREILRERNCDLTIDAPPFSQ